MKNTCREGMFNQRWGFVILITLYLHLRECNGSSGIMKMFSPGQMGEGARSETSARDADILLAKSFLPSGYNKYKIPRSRLNNQTQIIVAVGIFIHELLEIDEKKETLLMDADLSIRWLDGSIFDHLVKTNWTDQRTKETKKRTKVEEGILEYIWTPDIFIKEMLSMSTTSLLHKSLSLDLLGETGNSDRGQIAFSQRMTLKLLCGMSFHHYPADTQTCKFHLRSFSYTVEEVLLKWKLRTGIGVFLDKPDNPNFYIQISSVEPFRKLESINIEEKYDKYKLGNYSALTFVLKLRRKLSYHIVQTYLPSTLLIFITWLCFLLPTNMVEARIGVSMTTLLTLTAMFAAIRQQSPAVSYTMAIDAWMVFCIFFVFLVLLLFTTIYWMKSQLKQKKGFDDNMSTIIDEDTLEGKTSHKWYHCVVKCTKVYAFWIFSCIFLSFFFSYWGFLLYNARYLQWKHYPEFNGVRTNDGNSSNLYILHERTRQSPYASTTFLQVVLEDKSQFGEEDTGF